MIASFIEHIREGSPKSLPASSRRPVFITFYLTSPLACQTKLLSFHWNSAFAWLPGLRQCQHTGGGSQTSLSLTLLSSFSCLIGSLKLSSSPFSKFMLSLLLRFTKRLNQIKVVSKSSVSTYSQPRTLIIFDIHGPDQTRPVSSPGLF